MHNSRCSSWLRSRKINTNNGKGMIDSLGLCLYSGNGVHIMSDLFTPRVDRELWQFDDGDDNADNIRTSSTTILLMFCHLDCNQWHFWEWGGQTCLHFEVNKNSHAVMLAVIKRVLTSLQCIFSSYCKTSSMKLFATIVLKCKILSFSYLK